MSSTRSMPISNAIGTPCGILQAMRHPMCLVHRCFWSSRTALTAARFRCDPAAVWLCRLSRAQGVSEWRLCVGVLHGRLERALDAYRDRYSRQGSNPSRALDRVARSDRVRREYPARLRVWQHSSDPDLPCIAAGAGARRQAQRVCVSYRTAARSTRRRGAATASRASSRT